MPVDTIALQMLGILLAAIMGLQHSLAMVGGLITPPLVLSSAANDVGITQVLIVSILCMIVSKQRLIWHMPILTSIADLLLIDGVHVPFLSFHSPCHLRGQHAACAVPNQQRLDRLRDLHNHPCEMCRMKMPLHASCTCTGKHACKQSLHPFHK